MASVGKFAILMDGGFVTKKLSQRHGRFPTANDIEAECTRIKRHEALADKELLRNYWYDARPATDTIANPLDGQSISLGTTRVLRENSSLQQAIELLPDFALRAGETVVHGWQLGGKAMQSLSQTPRQLEPRDLIPNIEQKGVDLRIGLDIARLSLRQLVDVIVLVSGDSDFVPALKFARREGIRVFLDHMGHGVRR